MPHTSELTTAQPGTPRDEVNPDFTLHARGAEAAFQADSVRVRLPSSAPWAPRVVGPFRPVSGPSWGVFERVGWPSRWWHWFPEADKVAGSVPAPAFAGFDHFGESSFLRKFAVPVMLQFAQSHPVAKA